MAPIQRLPPYSGPSLFSYGFRPFFLFASLFAGLAIALWLPTYFGDWTIPTAFQPRDWHAHEMIYGYGAGVIAGFLLTAIPNWTGHLPLQGRPLAALTAVWIAGRLAMAFSRLTGPVAAAAIDLAFLALLIGVVGRELRHGSQKHNRKVLVVLGVLWLGDLLFHVEAIGAGGADYGLRLGIAATLVLVMLIGGRIIPSFTRNWLSRMNPGPLPAPLGRFDVAATLLAAATLAAWVAAPEARATGAALAACSVVQAVRLARWRGDRAWRDRLVLVLHVAYAFIPLGFALTALSAFGLAPISAGEHAWTIGVFGGMTLAVMSRASLGHTGRALVATPLVQGLYALVGCAALARICAALEPEWTRAELSVSALAWVAAFCGFALCYWRVFTGPKRTG
jgi:uncharacterized protein involved in response to NO